VPLYRSMDDVINWLMGSNLSQLTSSKLFLHTQCLFKFIPLLLSVSYCHQMSLVQSDPIKWNLLFYMVRVKVKSTQNQRNLIVQALVTEVVSTLFLSLNRNRPHLFGNKPASSCESIRKPIN